MFLINVFLLTDTDQKGAGVYLNVQVCMWEFVFVCHRLTLCVYVLSDRHSGGICDSGLDT